MLDQSALGVTLPDVADYFDASIPTVQWVTLAYMLTIGALLLPMGRLADMLGRKRVYVLGFIVFAVSAGLTGSSTNIVALIGFKAAQGVGSAMVQATGMAIITSAFPSSERGKVIGTYMTAVGLGAIVGPVFGGGVVSALDWRYVFYSGVPFGVVAVVLSIFGIDGAVDRGRDRSGDRGFDWPGACLSAGMVAVFLLLMTNAHSVGWGSPVSVSSFAAVFIMFVSFVWWERRAREPMLDLALFRRGVFSLGVSSMFLSFLGGTAVFFLMPFYIQKVLGYSPGHTGLIMVPAAICFALSGPVAGRLSDRFGPRWLAPLGLVLIGASLMTMSRMDEATQVQVVVASLVLLGLGMGMFYSPNASAVLSTVDMRRYGIATAFLNMVRNTANVTGVALSTSIVTATMSAQGFEPSLDAVSSAGGEAIKEAFTDGLQTAYLAMSGVVVVALALSLVRPGSAVSPRGRVEAEPRPERVKGAP